MKTELAIRRRIKLLEKLEAEAIRNPDKYAFQQYRRERWTLTWVLDDKKGVR